MAQGADVGCNVTRPNGILAGSAPGRLATSYGNRFISLPAPQEVVFRPGGPGFITESGFLVMKFLWGRAALGKLTVTGRRLDGVASALKSDIDNSHESDGFAPSYLIFPTTGCWEVTAQIGDLAESKLMFVTKVVKIGDGPSGRMGDPPFRR
jgi:hypothetical protein